MLNYLKATQSILGRNERNLVYTLPENNKEARSIADNKLRAKKVLRKEGLSVPKTYAIIKNKEELEKFNWNRLPASFALKPNKGFAGEGILIVYGEKKRKEPDEEREWIRADGSRVNISFLKEHIANILDGRYSLKNARDKAYFEVRLKNLRDVKPYIYKGVPDVRIIVYNKVPVMAMLRLPTQESHGKANITIGAVGVGIDMTSGITTTAILHDQIIEYHPDTKMRLSGFKVPFWDKILEMAINAQIITGLGYVGVDIALDRDMGPVILEVNARPGLGIQIANNDSLKTRLERIKQLKLKTIKRGIRIAKELFGGEVEEEVETIVGKKMIGKTVTIKITGQDDQVIESHAKIDTGAGSSSIDKDLAIQLGYGDIMNTYESFKIPETLTLDQAKEYRQQYNDVIKQKYPEVVHLRTIKASNGITLRPVVDVVMEIEGTKIISKVNITERTSLKFPAIIGSRDLKPFLIDISKT